MNQREIRIFAPYVEAKRLPDVEIEAMTYEDCMKRAAEIGLSRFSRDALAKLSRIHYPHFGEYISGARRLDRERLFLFCMYAGCDYPIQWIELAEKKARAEYRAQSAQAIGEYVQQVFAQRAAA